MVSLAAMVSFISPYVYEMPSHHCPFDVLQSGYHWIGYPLYLLLGGGTPMVPALETAATSVNNAHLSELFLHCVPKVQEGQALSEAFDETKMVPGLALAMVRVGESTGALPEMLNHTSEFLDEEIDFSDAVIGHQAFHLDYNTHSIILDLQRRCHCQHGQHGKR